MPILRRVFSWQSSDEQITNRQTDQIKHFQFECTRHIIMIFQREVGEVDMGSFHFLHKFYGLQIDGQIDRLLDRPTKYMYTVQTERHTAWQTCIQTDRQIGWLFPLMNT